MSKRDHKASEQDWRSNPAPNFSKRDYPAKKSVKVTTVLGWIALAVMVVLMVKAVGS